MAIAPNNKVVFGDLFNQAWDYLYNRCNNIDRLVLPDGATRDYSITYKVDAGASTSGTGGGGAVVTIDNNTIPIQYSSNEVKNNLINFLQQRNCYNKSNVVVSSKGILMFWNAISAFCQSNCVLLTGEWVSGVHVYYEPKNDYVEVPPLTDDATLITNNDINNALNNLEDILKYNTKSHKITYNISAFSSSSCCNFIGYIKGVN